MAHIGEEFGFGVVCELRLRLLLQVTLGQVGELLRLHFESLPRLPQIGDGRHQAPLRIHQLLFVFLQFRDVGSNRHIAAILRAPLVDL